MPTVTHSLTTEELAALQDGLLRLLIEFDRVCQRLGIPYQLGAGTLLGAVRHQGFVPWDDDADVCLLRADYERFLTLAQSELAADFFLQHPDSEPAHPWPFAKLRLSGTEFVSPVTEALDIHQGIYLDIFPFDDVRPDHFLGRCHLGMTGWVMIGQNISLAGHYNKFAIKRSYPVRLIIRLCYRLLRRLGEERINQLIRWLVFVFNRRQHLIEEESRYVTCLVSGTLYSQKKRMRRIRRYVDFIATTQVTFRGYSFPAPENYDQVLTNLYGDYKKLPPLEMQRPTHSIVRFSISDTSNPETRTKDQDSGT